MESANLRTIRSPWADLGLFLRLLGFALLALVILGMLAGNLPRPVSNTTLKLEQMVSTILLFGLPAYLYGRFRYPDRPLFHLGFRPATRANFYLLGILLLLFSFPLEAWLGLINKGIPLPGWMTRAEESAEKQLTAILAVKSTIDIVFNLVVVAVVPAVFEELCFRGVLQPIFIRLTKSPWAGIILTAFWFSFLHFQFSGFLPRMFLGILLGAAYWYSGSLWTSILGHCFFNGVQVLLLYTHPEMMNDKMPSIPVYTVLISLVIIVSLVSAMRKQSSPTPDNDVQWH